MTSAFYSDRTHGPRPRDRQHVPVEAWRALIALIDGKIEGNWLASDFPDRCPDGNGVAGTDRQNLFDAMFALVGIEWPPYRGEEPETATALDLIDFVAQRVAEPKSGQWHSFFKHHELLFDRAAGQEAFRQEVNLVFSRTGVAFELGTDMRVARLGPPETRQLVADLRPVSGDPTLDALLLEARRRYLSREPGDARTGVEKLWDAFERLKTVEPGDDKKSQVTALLDRVATGAMRQVLEDESLALTKIGNGLQIRHFEAGKGPVSDDDVDYLFARAASFVLHVLRATGRLGT